MEYVENQMWFQLNFSTIVILTSMVMDWYSADIKHWNKQRQTGMYNHLASVSHIFSQIVFIALVVLAADICR